jgi:hypothetical protein
MCLLLLRFSVAKTESDSETRTEECSMKTVRRNGKERIFGDKIFEGIIGETRAAEKAPLGLTFIRREEKRVCV